MRISMKGLGLVVLTLGGAPWACGGSTSGGGGDGTGGGAGGGITIAQACADVAKASCARRDACTNAAGVKSRYGDEATCETREALACTNGLSAPGTANSAANVEACAGVLPTESCTDYLDNNPTGACAPPAGTGANGSPCAVAAQCQSTYCAIPKGSACGACAAIPKAGDSCAVTGGCGRDLYCGRTDDVCVAYAASGATCDRGNHPCDRGLTCVGITKTTPQGTCKPSATTVGASCDPKAQTGAGCDRDLGLWCDATSSKCIAVGFAAAGADCGETAAGTFVACEAGATCNVPTNLPPGTPKKGTCAAAAADGAACDTGNGPSCTTPARCIGSAGDGGAVGTCQIIDPTTCK